MVSVSTGDHMGVVTHDTGAVVNLLGDLVALLRHDVLALLDMGRVHNSVILLVALLGVLCVAGGLLVGVVQGLAGSVVNSELVTAVGLRSHHGTMSHNVATNSTGSSQRGRA